MITHTKDCHGFETQEQMDTCKHGCKDARNGKGAHGYTHMHIELACFQNKKTEGAYKHQCTDTHNNNR